MGRRDDWMVEMLRIAAVFERGAAGLALSTVGVTMGGVLLAQLWQDG